MKVLICHNYYIHRGGEAQAVSRDAELLRRQGNEIRFLTRDSRDINKYSFKKKAALPFRAFHAPSTFKEIRTLVQEFQPDIAHVHNVFPLFGPSLYSALETEGIPIVQTMHNFRYSCVNGLFLDPKGRLCERCLHGTFIHGIWRRCYRSSFVQSGILSSGIQFHKGAGTYEKIKMFIFPSHFIRDKMVSAGIPRNKSIVRNNFAFKEEFPAQADADNYVVFIGRLSREKGVDILIKSWRKGPDIPLHIIGNGPMMPWIKSKIFEFGLENKVILHGQIDGADRFDLMKKALFTIFPSICYEAFPLVLVESMALGVPVLASRIGGFEEVIEEGRNGYLFDPGNSRDLRRMASILVENRVLLSTMRKLSRKLYLQNYADETSYRKLHDAYVRARGMEEWS